MKKIKQRHFYNTFNFFLVIKLIFRNYWKNKFNFFNDFILPLILTFILVSVLRKLNLVDFYPGLILTPIFSIGFISFPISFVEWKKSTLFKRFSIIGFNIKILLIIFGVYYTLLCYFAIMLTILYSYSIDKILSKSSGPEIKSLIFFIKNANLLWFFIGALHLNIVVFCFGFLLTFISKNTKNIIGFGIILLLLHSFFLGCYLPVRYTLNSKIISYLNYIFPGYGPIRISQASFLQSDQLKAFHLTFLDAEWKLHFNNSLNNAKIETFSVWNNYYSHILLSWAWIIVELLLIIVLSQRKKN